MTKKTAKLMMAYAIMGRKFVAEIEPEVIYGIMAAQGYHWTEGQWKREERNDDPPFDPSFTVYVIHPRKGELVLITDRIAKDLRKDYHISVKPPSVNPDHEGSYMQQINVWGKWQGKV